MAEFVVGRTYNRRADLHARYGGSFQSGISTSASEPVVFLFTGASGERHGYRDGPQPDGTFWYTGEGQLGDMQLTRGNLAIVEADPQGRELHLFEQLGEGLARYLGQAHYLGHHSAIGPDREGNERKTIVFELELEDGEEGPSDATPDLRAGRSAEGRGMWTEPLHTLREKALASAPRGAPPVQRRLTVQIRSEAVKVYVLRRAEGRCEGCGVAAPFRRPDHRPYLEPHHIRRLADGGPDHPRWVVALCPNCHRRVHFADDGDMFNKALAEKVGRIEGRHV